MYVKKPWTNTKHFQNVGFFTFIPLQRILSTDFVENYVKNLVKYTLWKLGRKNVDTISVYTEL